MVRQVDPKAATDRHAAAVQQGWVEAPVLRGLVGEFMAAQGLDELAYERDYDAPSWAFRVADKPDDKRRLKPSA